MIFFRLSHRHMSGQAWPGVLRFESRDWEKGNLGLGMNTDGV